MEDKGRNEGRRIYINGRDTYQEVHRFCWILIFFFQNIFQLKYQNRLQNVFILENHWSPQCRSVDVQLYSELFHLISYIYDFKLMDVLQQAASSLPP